MSKILIVFAFLCVGISALTSGSYGASSNYEHQGVRDSSAQAVNPVVQWNRTLLVIVRTPGAQPATIHSTRSFAIMHAAIYDPVNALDRKHNPYLVTSPALPPNASHQAPPPAAPHDALPAPHPTLHPSLPPAPPH